MKNKCLLLLVAFLAGCQGVSPAKPTESNPTAVTSDSWNGQHLDLVQFIAQENGFSCLAPSGVDFSSDGKAFKKTLCFKTEKCETTTRIIYLDAHSMLVASTMESRTPAPGKCDASAAK